MKKREESRRKIITAAAQGFRSNGWGGIGVDGLAKGAGLTSGAFYFHFRSKMEAFIASLEEGLEELREGVLQIRAENGPAWIGAFVSYYLGFKRTCPLAQGCSLPAMTPEVERAGPEARQAYQARLLAVAEAVAGGLPRASSASEKQRAWAMLALLSGGVNMARAVEDPALSEEIATAVERAVLAMADPLGDKSLPD